IAPSAGTDPALSRTARPGPGQIPGIPAAGAAAPSMRVGALRYLGQLDHTYLVCEGAGELVLLDQHGALERVALEALRRRHAAGDLARQPLLFPRTVEVGDAEARAAEALAGPLGALGFE